MSIALVVKPKDEAEVKFLSSLLEKLGVQSTLVDEDLIEDLGMSLLLKDVDKTKKISRESILKKLRS
jgi:hypothetical protein